MRVAGSAVLVACVALAHAQDHGTLRGRVVLEKTGDPLHRASVLILELGRKTETDHEGLYEFREVPAGTYAVIAHLHPLSDLRRVVTVPAGGVAELDFRLVIAPIHEQITVTASGREQTTLEAFQASTSLELLDLVPRTAASLGEVLESEVGVSKRSFGPGSSRPVVRGFDGDRVLILQDGLPTGTLSSQSGDHGEPVNVAAVERVEVVRGPATLLYGSNALGGVVNVITSHHQLHQHPHEGLRGFLAGSAGSNNGLGSGTAGLEAGKDRWLVSASGGGMRTSDYHSPLGVVSNSHTHLGDASSAVARYGQTGFIRGAYHHQAGRYGVPLLEELGHAHGEQHHEHHAGQPVDLRWRRHNARLTAASHVPHPALEHFTLNINYSDWSHQELVGEEVGTKFINRQLTWRGIVDQKPGARLRGSFGIYGLHRRYRILGAEQLTPPVAQCALAGFGLQEVQFERLRLQFGLRLESNRYKPRELPGRAFTGLSGSAGVIVGLTSATSLLASVSRSYRAPAMEELYNYGPHHGNLAFEIGDPALRGERANGLELALRVRTRRLRAESNAFYYLLRDYVYLAPTGQLHGGLIESVYRQADSRYMGAEASMQAALTSDVWLKLGLDCVDAQLRRSRVPLPRIPPARARLGLDARWKGFGFQPELVLAASQSQLYYYEKRTPGYALLNLGFGYIRAHTHALHSFSVLLFNATDRVYRNHVSLIKDLVAEIGRGVRVNYTLRFF